MPILLSDELVVPASAGTDLDSKTLFKVLKEAKLLLLTEHANLLQNKLDPFDVVELQAQDILRAACSKLSEKGQTISPDDYRWIYSLFFMYHVLEGKLTEYNVELKRQQANLQLQEAAG